MDLYKKRKMRQEKMINENKEEKVTDLLSTLTKDWPIEAGLYFLSLLYDKRAVNIIENN